MCVYLGAHKTNWQKTIVHHVWCADGMFTTGKVLKTFGAQLAPNLVHLNHFPDCAQAHLRLGAGAGPGAPRLIDAGGTRWAEERGGRSHRIGDVSPQWSTWRAAGGRGRSRCVCV